jgi:hypothetical protein
MVSTYAPIDDAKLPSILAGLPEVSVKLGGAPAEWRVREVGDGNLRGRDEKALHAFAHGARLVLTDPVYRGTAFQRAHKPQGIEIAGEFLAPCMPL